MISIKFCLFYQLGKDFCLKCFTYFTNFITVLLFVHLHSNITFFCFLLAHMSILQTQCICYMYYNMLTIIYDAQTVFDIFSCQQSLDKNYYTKVLVHIQKKIEIQYTSEAIYFCYLMFDENGIICMCTLFEQVCFFVNILQTKSISSHLT